MQLIIKTLAGLENLLAEEVSFLTGKEVTKLTRAVGLFEAEEEDIFKINYLSRYATHVLLTLKEGDVKNEDELYDFARSVPWTEYMTTQQTFAIYPTILSDRFKHTGFAALKVKDALADHFREKVGRRPNVDKEAPDVSINIHIFRDQASISLNTSGAALFQRGYKAPGAYAPLSEVLAAGLIGLSGWTADQAFYDPMCGSGTIALEAALKGMQVPAQKYRKTFAFEHFTFLNTGPWKRLKRSIRQDKTISPPRIYASDQDKQALSWTRKNAYQAKMDGIIDLQKKDFFQSEAPEESGMIIVNPPYDERLELAEASTFYKNMGDHLKRNYPGWTAWVLSGHIEAMKHFGLKPSQKHTLFNGKIECTYRKYELY
jgi:putative N6-adenine-specific DNA methylase